MEVVKIRTSGATSLKTVTTGSVSVKLRTSTNTVYRKGYSPYIDPETQTWWEYDDAAGCFVDTGVCAVDIVLATRDAPGVIIVGENLSISEDGILSVDTATEVGTENRPVTAAAVNKEIGNIEALMGTI